MEHTHKYVATGKYDVYNDINGKANLPLTLRVYLDKPIEGKLQNWIDLVVPSTEFEFIKKLYCSHNGGCEDYFCAKHALEDYKWTLSLWPEYVDLNNALWDEVDGAKLFELQDEISNILYHKSDAYAIIHDWYEEGLQFTNKGYTPNTTGTAAYVLISGTERFHVLVIDYGDKKAKLVRNVGKNILLDGLEEHYKEYINNDNSFESNIDYYKTLAMLRLDSFAEMFVIE